MIGEPKEPNMYENQQPQAGEPVSAETNPESQIPPEIQEYLESVKSKVEAEGQMTAQYEEPAKEKGKESKWRKWTAGLMAGTVLAIGLGLPALSEAKGGKGGYDPSKNISDLIKGGTTVLNAEIKAQRDRDIALAEARARADAAARKAERDEAIAQQQTKRVGIKAGAQAGVYVPGPEVSPGGTVRMERSPTGGSIYEVRPGGRETEQRGESQADAYLHQFMVDKAIKDYINGTPEIPKDAPVEHQRTYAFQYNKMLRDIPKEGRSMIPMP